MAARGLPREPRGDDGERDGVEGGAELADGAQGEHLVSLDPRKWSGGRRESRAARRRRPFAWSVGAAM